MPTPTPAKRSRISNSPSFGDTAAVIRRQLPPRALEPSDRRCSSASANSDKLMKPAAQEAQRDWSPSSSSSPAILTVSSPEIVRGEPGASDQFLDECYLCRKRFPHNSEVFMYGPFGAFCSESCRFQQIYKDRVAEQLLAKSTGNAVGGVKSNNVN